MAKSFVFCDLTGLSGAVPVQCPSDSQLQKRHDSDCYGFADALMCGTARVGRDLR